ncbi:MAG: DegQ family serine endoprotease [bacterium]|nr:DegQ family serine endoprotease [bacterium]
MLNRSWRVTVMSLIAVVTVGVLGVFSTGDVLAQSKENSGMQSLRALNEAFIQIAKEVTPSVVTVSTEKVVKMRGIGGLNPNFGMFNDPFEQFFNMPKGNQSPQQEQRQQGLGSGVVVSEDGYILTNNHVIAGADSIVVRFSDGKSLAAKVIGADEKTDIAVIRVEAKGLTPIKQGSSDDLQVGEMVMAIGSPLNPNLAHTVTQGIVSAKGRSNVGLADYEDFIQTDAAINPGNSGGALVNLDGELVGVNTAIASRSGGFQGIGFAVPVNMALDIMNELISNGKVVRGWLGVGIQDVNEVLARAMGLEENSGVLIGSVAPESPAENAGIAPGDVVIKVNSTEVTNSAQLRNLIARTEPGTTVTLGLLRDSREKALAVKLGELPEQDESGAIRRGGPSNDQERGLDPGFDVGPVTREFARQFDLPENTAGVVVTDIDESSAAYRQGGLRAGDVVREVNRKPIASVQEFESALRGLKQGSPLLLLVSRGEQQRFVAFDIG